MVVVVVAAAWHKAIGRVLALMSGVVVLPQVLVRLMAVQV